MQVSVSALLAPSLDAFPLSFALTSRSNLHSPHLTSSRHKKSHYKSQFHVYFAVSCSSRRKMSALTTLGGLSLNDNARTISPFEALPAELRHEILRYVLHTKQARLPKPQRVTYPGKDKITKSRSFDWHVQVLQVCRTLYNDGKDILYRENQVSLRKNSLSRLSCQAILIIHHSSRSTTLTLLPVGQGSCTGPSRSVV